MSDFLLPSQPVEALKPNVEAFLKNLNLNPIRPLDTIQPAPSLIVDTLVVITHEKNFLTRKLAELSKINPFIVESFLNLQIPNEHIYFIAPQINQRTINQAPTDRLPPLVATLQDNYLVVAAPVNGRWQKLSVDAKSTTATGLVQAGLRVIFENADPVNDNQTRLAYERATEHYRQYQR